MQINDIHQKIKEKFPSLELVALPNALVIPQSSLFEVAGFLKNEMDFENCHCITAVDRKDKMEVVYLLYSTPNHFMLTLKVIVELNDLTVKSLTTFWKSANWLEREVYDLFGIKFLNHPDLRRIMNPDHWTDFPLRKDFKRPDFIPRPQTMGLKG